MTRRPIRGIGTPSNEESRVLNTPANIEIVHEAVDKVLDILNAAPAPLRQTILISSLISMLQHEDDPPWIALQVMGAIVHGLVEIQSVKATHTREAS